MYEDQVKYMISVLWLLALLSCIPYIQANTYNIPSSTYPCKRPRSLDEYFLHKSFITFSVVTVVALLVLWYCLSVILKSSVDCTLRTQFALSHRTQKQTERHRSRQKDKEAASSVDLWSGWLLPFPSVHCHFIYISSSLFPWIMKRSKKTAAHWLGFKKHHAFCYFLILS